MAQKTATLNIKVTGQQTLGQIEDELTQINEELKGVDVNSDAFKDLSKQAQKAKFSLDEVNNSIEGVTSVKRAEGAKKLGEGLVGGFAAAASAAALFGDESSEALQKATQKAVLMFTALDGLEKVSKAFSKEATDGLKSLAGGFTKSIKAVRLFGLSSAASLALATAGITVLITAVIALVANFDKVTAWFDDLAESFPIINSIAEGFKQIWEWISLIDNLWDGFIGAIKTIGDDSKTMADGFNEALDASLKQEDSLEKLEKFRKEGIKDLERELKIAESLKNNDEKVFKLKENIIKTEINLLKNAGELNKTETERLKDLDTELKVLENQEKIRQESLKTEEKITVLTEQQIADKELQEKLDINRLKLLRDEEKILIELNLLRGDNLNENLKLQKALLESELFLLQEINNPLTDRQRAELEISELYVKRVALENKLIVLGETRAKDLVDFQRIQNEILSTQNNILDIDIKREVQNNKLYLINKKQQSEIFDEEEKQRNKINKNIVETAIKELEVNELLSFRSGLLGEVVDLNKDNLKLFIAQGDAADVLRYKLEESALALSLLGDAVGVGFEAMFVSLDNELINLDSDLATIQKRQAEFNESEIDYQKLLKDANGEKFAAIEKDMLAQDALREELAQNEKDKLNEIAQAEYKQAQLQKQQAIVQSLINTALAVVQALPNIPLSIIVGALGLASTGTIIGSKIPKPPKYDEGGYTKQGKDTDAFPAVLHGNEYVVPANVLRTDEGNSLVSTLEGIRGSIQGFADGGYTSPPTVSNGSTVSNNNQQTIWVSVAEIESVGRNVKVIESKSSL